MIIEGGPARPDPPGRLRVGARPVTLAAVCRRGHVVRLDAGRLPDPNERTGHCEECGARVLRVCRSCEAPVLGVPPEADAYGNLEVSGWSRPEFCRECGAPFPWVDRAGRIRHLENLLDDEELDEATELAVREQLEALANPDLSEDEQRRRWQRIKEWAPGLWRRGANVIEGLVAAAIRQQLGI